ncbi:MAG: hypothetical protein EWM51_06140 [Treponema sp.]|nr:MAG: hypothetical protein EWM51_06140 [Treponema sp.]
MSKKSGNLFLNIMTSGKSFDSRDEASMDTMVRYILLNFLIFLGGTLLFIFGFENLAKGQFIQAVADLCMGSLTIVAFITLRTNALFMVSSLMTVVPFAVLCAFFAQSGGAQGSGVMWSFSFPMMAVFLLGMGPGIFLSVLVFAVILLSLFLPGFSPLEFHPSFAFRTVGVYVLVLAITVVYELTKMAKERSVFKLNKVLQAERDEIAAMKDNLKVGLFLMDGGYEIQPQYSAALEDILSENALQGHSFIEYLRNSLQDREQETLQDYFQMVYNRSFDSRMLEDINPLHQFTYVHGVTGEEKTLRCSFTPITREDGRVLILGALQDVTREVELQKQLEQEEGKREQEMHALFEVIHVEPRVLNDFIEDTDFEFNRINEILKDKTRTAKQTMIDMYQSVHAIKSNAVILGLESFSKKLHKLEDEIRILRDGDSVSFEETLHITVELDKLMKIKDGFKDIIRKIANFTRGESRMQEDTVLRQTLEKTVDKASSELGKKARLVVGRIDPAAIERGPRRVMKEVLMQLVRNAVYHGIEKPEVRESGGKSSIGEIHLSVELVDDSTIVMELKDDGKGLDFAAIRDKVAQSGLFSDSSKLEDKNALVQALFESGFSTASHADLYAGRGVGLNLVKERVSELKGSINIKSEVGRGTTFKISIPASPASGAAISA